MNKFTPGPWKAVTEDNQVLTSDGETLIASPDGQVGREARNANARLIAAAPDLLKSLNAVLEGHADHKLVQEFGGYTLPDFLLAQVRIAIAKAEGK